MAWGVWGDPMFNGGIYRDTESYGELSLISICMVPIYYTPIASDIKTSPIAKHAMDRIQGNNNECSWLIFQKLRAGNHQVTQPVFTRPYLSTIGVIVAARNGAITSTMASPSIQSPAPSQ